MVIIRCGKIAEHMAQMGLIKDNSLPTVELETKTPREDGLEDTDSDNDYIISNKKSGKVYRDLKLKKGENMTCIVHFDSLRMHSTTEIGKHLIDYLDLEWATRAQGDDASKPRYSDVKGSPVKVSNLYSTSNVEFFSCESAPRQQNGFDCGLFVIKFMEMFMEMNPTSTKEDIQGKLKVFDNYRFSQDDVNKYRSDYSIILDTIEYDWIRENVINDLKKQRAEQNKKEIQEK